MIQKFLIGIDTGVKTGFAVAVDDLKGFGAKLTEVETLSITQSMKRVLELVATNGKENICLYIEDARKRTGGFGYMDKQQAKSGAGVREGVGSVKRDATIWEDWCKEEELNYKLIHPAANNTKYTADVFKRLTGWKERTSVHARDASMLVHKKFAKF